MLKPVFLIARREYLERIRSKVFRITTVLVPVGMAALVAVAGFGTHRMEGVRRMAILSNSRTLAQGVKAALEDNQPAPESVEIVAPGTRADRSRLKDEIATHRIDGYLDVETATGETEPQATWFLGGAINFMSRMQMETAVRSALIREQLLARGVNPDAVQKLMQPISLKTMQVQQGGVVAEHNKGGFLGTAYVLILVLYGSVLIYGVNIARSVVEEKTSRVFEVLLSTTSADSLMMGKLLGVGAAGLTQIGIWAALLVFFAGSTMATHAGIHGLASLGITVAELIYFAVFFLSGFLLYSGLAAALGASVSGDQDVQQFTLILVAPLVASVLLLPYVLGNPNSTASVVLSLIPPFTPIILYMRICAQMPPVWQIGLGIALLLGSVWGVVWLAARIYRVGVLMYGKRATVPEMLRWLRYS